MEYTQSQKEIIKKLGRVPRIKGSIMYRKFYEPESYAKESEEYRKKFFSNLPKHKALTEKEKRDYQDRIGRAYNE